MDILQTLDDKCNTRFAPLLKKLNAHVVVTPMVDHTYNKPEVLLTADVGVTVSLESSTVIDLGTAARVKVNQTPHKAVTVTTRAAIPTSEILTALNNDSYFGYIFDRIMEQIIAKLSKQIGAFDQMRWGEYYIKLEPFSMFESRGNEEDMIEIRLTTKIASDEKA